MIVWELSTTDGETTSYRFFAMKGEAGRAKREYKKAKIECDGPEKIVVRNRDDLIALIGKVQGAQPDTDAAEDTDDAADEFI